MRAFLARAKMTFRAFTTWLHLVRAFLISGSPSSIASHATSARLVVAAARGSGRLALRRVSFFLPARVDGTSASVMSLDARALQRAARARGQRVRAKRSGASLVL